MFPERRLGDRKHRKRRKRRNIESRVVGYSGRRPRGRWGRGAGGGAVAMASVGEAVRLGGATDRRRREHRCVRRVSHRRTADRLKLTRRRRRRIAVTLFGDVGRARRVAVPVGLGAGVTFLIGRRCRGTVAHREVRRTTPGRAFEIVGQRKSAVEVRYLLRRWSDVQLGRVHCGFKGREWLYI